MHHLTSIVIIYFFSSGRILPYHRMQELPSKAPRPQSFIVNSLNNSLRVSSMHDCLADFSFAGRIEICLSNTPGLWQNYWTNKSIYSRFFQLPQLNVSTGRKGQTHFANQHTVAAKETYTVNFFRIVNLFGTPKMYKII